MTIIPQQKVHELQTRIIAFLLFITRYLIIKTFIYLIVYVPSFKDP